MLIIAYHAIEDGRSLVSTSPARLRAHLLALRRAGYRFVSLDECAAWLGGSGAVPPRAAAITFDDGYASVAERGVPILHEHGVPGTVFVVAGRLGAHNDWPGQWAGVPRRPLLDEAALRGLTAGGIAIGAHSVSHRSLPALDADAVRLELVDSARRLEEVTGRPVHHFAYPYGDRDARVIRLAAERYQTACNATAGIVTRNSSPSDLPRLDAHDLDVAVRFGLTSPRAMRPYLAVRRVLRAMRRRASRATLAAAQR